ncbi:MAG: hypothetical protein ABW124_01995 [Candidatus Thiodiazotropha sp. 6PLUC9]
MKSRFSTANFTSFSTTSWYLLQSSAQSMLKVWFFKEIPIVAAYLITIVLARFCMDRVTGEVDEQAPGIDAWLDIFTYARVCE